MKKIHNFSAGPCILPPSVLSKASQAVQELDNTGLSLIEMSHRSPEFVAIMEKARSLVKELLNVPSGYEVLFLQGGASLGFLTAAYNFRGKTGKSAYVDTGTWSSKAIKEAKRLSNVQVLASSKETGYDRVPKYSIPEDVDFFHFTSNNTIYGNQFQNLPKSQAPMICDMSSDIFSRQINVADYDLIYAGAQKNMGPAGTVVYIVKTDALNPEGMDIPTYLDLKVHIDKDSMFNTPPVFAVYTSMLMLEWLKDLGGVPAIEKINNEKAALIYDEIDRNSLFEGHTQVEDRSKMNVTFRLTDDSLESKFNEMWKEAGISGIKGHRSVGGYRASIYNAMPKESIQVLVDVMKKLESTNS